MPIRNGKKVTGFPGLWLKSKDKISDAVINFSNVNTAPTTTSGYYYLYVQSGVLKYDNGSSVISITGGGSGVVPSWETLYLNDATFALTTAPWTITQSAAANLLALNKTNVGAGTVLAITNSGTGKDITGSAWSIATAAAVGVLELTSGGTINATDGALSIGKTGTATTLVGTCTVSEGLTVTAGGATITSGNLVVTAGNTTLTLGNLTLTNGIVSLTSTSNTAAGVSLINNTITTYGAAAASGAVEIVSTSLTTGTLLHLELTEGTLNGGYYMRAWDVTAGAAVFSVAEDGNTVIAGTLAGTAALTLTAGDLVLTAGDVLLSEGKLTMVDTSDEAVVTITADAVTTNNVVDINADGLTNGAILHLDTSVAGMNTGYFIQCYDGAADAFAVKKYGAVTIAGNAATDVLTLTAGNIVVTAGDATFTNGSVSVTNTANETALTVVADAVTDGIVIDVNADGVTTGTILHLDSSAAGFSGLYIDCFDGAASDFSVGLYGATIIAGNAGSNVFTVTAGDLVVSDGSLTITDADEASTVAITNNTAASVNVVSVTANAITDGSVLYLASSAAGMTTGNFINCYNGAATVFEVGLYGATTITGNAATDVLTITAGHAVLTSGNLTLTSGNLVLTSGNATLTSGNLTLTSGNAILTSGNLTLTAGSIIQTPQAIVNANTAIDVIHGVTTIANNAPSTHTFADGTVGQRKTIVCTVYTGDAVITPDNLANGSTVTLNAVGDACDLVFLGTEWWVTNLYGTAALA